MSSASLLYPRNIAIVGATAKPGWCAEAMKNLEDAGYPGPVYPVNPRYEEIRGLPCYPSLADLPEPADQIVFLIPAGAVVNALENLGDTSVRSVVIYSSGFSETGTEEGALLEERLRAVLAERQIASCGPNCLGYASFPAHAVTLTAPSVEGRAEYPGTAGIVAQSGGVGLALNRRLTENGAPARYVVSSGNEVGTTVEDWIECFVDDPEVRSIGAFIESLKDPQRFWSLCLRAAEARKPLVILKSGASAAAREAAVAHTGRLAGSAVVFRDVARAHGAVVVDTVEEVADVLSVHQPGLPVGSADIAAVTISGGLKGICLDSAERNRMRFPELSPDTLAALSAHLGVGTALGNPIDSGWAAFQNPPVVVTCAAIAAEDPGIGSVIVQATPGAPDDAGLDMLAKVAVESGKPIVLVQPGGGFVSDVSEDRLRAPLFQGLPLRYCPSVDRAVAALSSLREWQAHGGRSGRPGTTVSAVWAEEAVKAAKERLGLSRQSGLLDEMTSKRALEGWRIATPKRQLAASAEAAVAVLAEIGAPVILKVASEAIAHKAVLGLISLIAWLPADVGSEWERLERRAAEVLPGEAVEIWVEQALVGGVETATGLSRDAELGLVMMFGSGGALLEGYKDVAFSLPVADEVAACELIEQTIIGRHVLASGAESPRLKALETALVAIGRLAIEAGPAVVGLDVNPLTLFADERGAVALDASLTLAPGEE